MPNAKFQMHKKPNAKRTITNARMSTSQMHKKQIFSNPMPNAKRQRSNGKWQMHKKPNAKRTNTNARMSTSQMHKSPIFSNTTYRTRKSQMANGKWQMHKKPNAKRTNTNACQHRKCTKPKSFQIPNTEHAKAKVTLQCFLCAFLIAIHACLLTSSLFLALETHTNNK